MTLPSAPSATVGRVILVEDDERLRRGLSFALTRRGHEVVETGNGNEALRRLEQGAFDAIVSDVRMPELDGIQLLRAVRKHDLDLPVVLMTGVPDLKSAMEAVDLGALQYLAKPFALETFTNAVERAIALFRLARAKRAALELVGGGAGQAGDRAGLEASFARALTGMWIAFQPIVRAQEHTLFGYEALLRSREPTLPHPGAILDAAERLGRLHDLGQVVRSLASREFRDAPRDALLFVNLHAHDLSDASIASENAPLASIAHRVVLEITERASLDSVDDVSARASRLRDLGYRLAVDDLGAGYAGLTSFAVLEPEFVKLDMSLVRGIDESATKQKIVGAMCVLCHQLGKLVVAEGVETVGERDALVALGCDLLQGFLLARPGPAFPGFAW